MPLTESQKSNLVAKVLHALELLHEDEYVLPSIGRPIRGASIKELIRIANKYRLSTGIENKLYSRNLIKYLHNPSRAPAKFLHELTAILGLKEIGLDETLWEMPLNEFHTYIQTALRSTKGDPLSHSVSEFISISERVLTSADRLVATAATQNNQIAAKNDAILFRLERLNVTAS